MVGVSADFVSPIGSGEHLKTSQKHIDVAWAKIRKSLPTKKYRKEINKFELGKKKFNKLSKVLLKAYFEEDREAVTRLYDEWLYSKPLLFKSIDTIVAKQQKQVQTSFAKEKLNTTYTNTLVIGLAIAVAVAFTLVMTLLSRSIRGRISHLSEKFKTLAGGEGDLMIMLDSDAIDEIGDLSKSFNDFINKLRAIVVQIISISERLAVATFEMSKSSSGLSDNAQVQAGSAEQVSASVEEVDATVSKVAGTAEAQYETVSEMAERMQKLFTEINTMSNRIQEMQGLSHQISEQANLGQLSQNNLQMSMNGVPEISR